jgi:hypothetical protein
MNDNAQAGLQATVAGLRSTRRLPPPEIVDAPVMDEWTWTPSPIGEEGIFLVGLISAGDPEFPARRTIFTSQVREIDGGDAMLWARTSNSHYRLGSPKDELPLIMRAALAEDWREAMLVVAMATAKHTIPDELMDAYRTLRLANGGRKQAWMTRRMCACVRPPPWSMPAASVSPRPGACSAPTRAPRRRRKRSATCSPSNRPSRARTSWLKSSRAGRFWQAAILSCSATKRIASAQRARSARR